MAAAFSLLFFVVVVALSVALMPVVAARRDGDRVGWQLLAPTVMGVLFVYLVVKVVYEEVIPCVFIDETYCQFSSTQYWDLFGWEF